MIPKHPGATAYIVGRGPSLLALHREDFGPGPVISLNAAILTLRGLALPNTLYMMWKDGCQPHTWLDNDIGEHDCTLPFPESGEVFLTSLAEGRFCLQSWKARHVIDVQGEYGVPWWTMSAPVAVLVAHAMGATSLVMYGHDAYTSHGRDVRRVEAGGIITEDPHAGYYNAGAQAQEFADIHDMAIDWRTKVTA